MGNDDAITRTKFWGSQAFHEWSARAWLTLKVFPPLAKVDPSGRLLNVPKIGLAEVLLITLKTVPVVNVPVPVSTNVNVTLLLMVTPRAETLDGAQSLRANTHLYF